MWKSTVEPRAGHRWQYGARALRDGYLRLNTYTQILIAFRLQQLYARTRLIVTFIQNVVCRVRTLPVCECALLSTLKPNGSFLSNMIRMSSCYRWRKYWYRTFDSESCLIIPAIKAEIMKCGRCVVCMKGTRNSFSIYIMWYMTYLLTAIG